MSPGDFYGAGGAQNVRVAVVQPDADVCERLRRAVLEASKQCGRNRLMEIGEACTMPPSSVGITASM